MKALSVLRYHGTLRYNKLHRLYTKSSVKSHRENNGPTGAPWRRRTAAAELVGHRQRSAGFGDGGAPRAENFKIV